MENTFSAITEGITTALKTGELTPDIKAREITPELGTAAIALNNKEMEDTTSDSEIMAWRYCKTPSIYDGSSPEAMSSDDELDEPTSLNSL